MNFNIPYKTGQEINYISKVFEDNHYQSKGPFSFKVKDLLKTRFQMLHAHLVHSCTTALEMAAVLIDAQPEDEIIMPSYTYVTTANAFALRGCKIIFVDVDHNFNIDLEAVSKAITKKTKAIIPVHYCSTSCDMDRLMVMAEENNIYVIEDAAQCINAKYKDRYLGTIGHVGCLSFHETKNIQCGEGGVLVINNPDLITLANHIVEKGTNRKDFLAGNVDRYTWQTLGSSPLMNEITAAFLLAQLETIDDVTAHRLSLDYVYQNELGQSKEINTMCVPSYNSHNGHFYYLQCENTWERSELIAYLECHQIQALSHYEPLHSSVGGQIYGVFKGEDAYTTFGANTILRLPIYWDLSVTDVTIICNKIKEFYHEK